jgi:hypothetical protein
VKDWNTDKAMDVLELLIRAIMLVIMIFMTVTRKAVIQAIMNFMARIARIL